MERGGEWRGGKGRGVVERGRRWGGVRRGEKGVGREDPTLFCERRTNTKNILDTLSGLSVFRKNDTQNNHPTISFGHTRDERILDFVGKSETNRGAKLRQPGNVSGERNDFLSGQARWYQHRRLAAPDFGGHASTYNTSSYRKQAPRVYLKNLYVKGGEAKGGAYNVYLEFVGRVSCTGGDGCRRLSSLEQTRKCSLAQNAEVMALALSGPTTLLATTSSGAGASSAPTIDAVSSTAAISYLDSKLGIGVAPPTDYFPTCYCAALGFGSVAGSSRLQSACSTFYVGQDVGDT